MALLKACKVGRMPKLISVKQNKDVREFAYQSSEIKNKQGGGGLR